MTLRVDQPGDLAWQLFALLDDRADELDATFNDVLDVAAVVVASYVLRMRAELHARGLASPDDLTAGDAGAWRVFRERTQRLIDHSSVH